MVKKASFLIYEFVSGGVLVYGSMKELSNIWIAAALGIMVGCSAGRKSEVLVNLEQPSPAAEQQLKRFFAVKEQQARKLVEVDKAYYAESEEKPLVITKGIPPEIWPYFKASKKGDWKAVAELYRAMAARCYAFDQPTNQLVDARSYTTVWQPVNETYRAYEQLSFADPKYVLAFGQEIIGSIPTGSVYFAGSDAGRFVVTALAKSQIAGDPFFIISQNQLCDSLALAYLRSMYGKKLRVPGDQDSQDAFSNYVDDATKRLHENRLRLGENVQLLNGRVQISGAVAVMEVNAILAKKIFDDNPACEFYVDESTPLDWMYPHLVPHGLILKLNREPLPELGAEIVRQDRAYWDGQILQLIGDWLTDKTSVKNICEFAEKVYVRKDLTGFGGDRQFVQTANTWKPVSDFHGASAIFSKSRANIADLYAWRAQNATSPDERESMAKEADFAFRQALALCPYHSYTVGKFISFLFQRKQFEDAIRVARTAQAFHPGDEEFEKWVKQLVDATERH